MRRWPSFRAAADSSIRWYLVPTRRACARFDALLTSVDRTKRSKYGTTHIEIARSPIRQNVHQLDKAVH